VIDASILGRASAVPDAHDGRRRCHRCGAFLSAANPEQLCFPCQRATFEARTTLLRRRGD
jgi:hypothetical protein